MTGLVILAAGASTRLGKPKQNLVYQNNTLLQRAIETALASVCRPVIVILGADAEMIRPTLGKLSVHIFYNKDWREGMASSIRLGIAELQKFEPAITSVILMLCDQPFINASLINELFHAKEKKGIIACAYNDTVGTPVLFDTKYFDELSLLTGAEGAKKLLTKYPGNVYPISFPLGGVDIDTEEDFEKLG
ncbi:MAG TPA: nucleotidyltransferase family protein [Mucilaginibacter sp.]|jgi:molybdenum cofactor cytidylyltransferase|nr:nucleotidyltransferase family protein [Mucilaginibacter sp.]